MIELSKVIEILGKTPSYNDKQFILKRNENVSGLKDVLRFVYDPYVKTGISEAKLAKAMSMVFRVTIDSNVTYTEMIRYLKRHQTGSDADLVMAARFINCTKANYPDEPYTVEVAKAIVTQKLTIGVTATTLNKVYGKNFIPIVGCMLGTKYDVLGPIKTKWPCIVTEKLDGIRRILVKEEGVCRMFSRSGHEDTGLLEIMKDAAHLPDNRVYDGELLATGAFKDCIALRQASMSRSALKGIKTGLSFNIFDMIPIEEFRNGASEDKALARKIALAATFMDESLQILTNEWPMYIASFGMHVELQHIKSVPILGLVKSMEQVEPIVEIIWANGGEGVMLNTVEGLYEIKRSRALIKVKLTTEYNLKVTNMFEGTGKFEDMLGALVVDYNGVALGVGSGFTEAQRILIWQNPEDYIGRTIEIDSFGESTNQTGTKSLNCPIFKRFVGSEE